MGLLAFVLKGSCPYCIVSAVVSAAIFGVTLRGNVLGSARKALKVVVATAVVALGFSGVAFAATPTPAPKRPPAITEESSGRAKVSYLQS